MKFIVFSLPRSRSKWLAEFLSYNRLVCGHDLAAFARSIADFRQLLAGVDGSCETGAVAGWKLLRLEFPKARFVVVRRPIGEIVDSIRRQGYEPAPGVLETRGEMLDVLAKAPGVRAYDFADLADSGVCRDLFEFCLDLPFDPVWWRQLSQINIQIDFKERMEWLLGRQEETRNLLEEVAAANTRLRGIESCLGLN